MNLRCLFGFYLYVYKSPNFPLKRDLLGRVKVVDGRMLPVLGCFYFKVNIDYGLEICKLYAADIYVPILGRDFFLNYDCFIDPKNV